MAQKNSRTCCFGGWGCASDTPGLMAGGEIPQRTGENLLAGWQNGLNKGWPCSGDLRGTAWPSGELDLVGWAPSPQRVQHEGQGVKMGQGCCELSVLSARPGAPWKEQSSDALKKWLFKHGLKWGALKFRQSQEKIFVEMEYISVSLLLASESLILWNVHLQSLCAVIALRCPPLWSAGSDGLSRGLLCCVSAEK